jgi:hypothetical protein
MNTIGGNSEETEQDVCGSRKADKGRDPAAHRRYETKAACAERGTDQQVRIVAKLGVESNTSTTICRW